MNQIKERPETVVSSKPPDSVMPTFRVCWLHFGSGGDIYVGEISDFRFCGNRLTLEVDRMVRVRFVESGPEDTKPPRWIRIGEIIKNKHQFTFEGCQRVKGLTNPNTHRSSEGDELSFSSDPDDIRQVQELLNS